MVVSCRRLCGRAQGECVRLRVGPLELSTHLNETGNTTVVVANMAGSLLAHSFSLRPQPHIERQQEGDLSSIYQYDASCVQVAPNP